MNFVQPLEFHIGVHMQGLMVNPETLWNFIRRSPKEEVWQRKVVKFDSFYFHLFGTSPNLLLSVF